MAEYIDREKLIKDLKESAKHHADNTREESLLYRDRFLVREQPTADVIERSKIDDTIFEIKEGYYGDEEMSETDSERADAFNNGLSYALEILKRNIGE